jgi:D-methionine transport system ATP-binding protein
MSHPSPLIRLASVSKRFPGAGGADAFVAVDRVSLDIDAGERFGIIGSSGAGKSTLLRLINLLETPDTGSVEIDGQDLTRLSRRDLRAARAGIGMIFQQFNLLQNATVYDNVAFPLTIRRPRLSRADQRARVDECLKIVGLASKLDSYPAQLSGGQKQRVAIARALATRPAVMLCDEPTSALDSETTRSVLDILADINGRLGVTLVVVTHELAVARSLCQRVAVMADGRIVEDIAIERGGDRLETAIARANRGGADPSPIQAPTPRRVGGLPLPAKAAAPDAAETFFATAEARAAAAGTGWVCQFPVASDDLLTVDGTAPRPRRAGGLPLPGRFAPWRDERPLRPVDAPAEAEADAQRRATPERRSAVRGTVRDIAHGTVHV